MNTSGMDIKYLREKVESKLHRLNHSYINEMIGHPIVDEDQLVLLASLFGSQSSLSNAEKERFIITAMLTQIALEIHEQVPTVFEQDMSKDIKAKNQLRVLAGDYYSGHYYLLLAEMNAIELISTLASAIKEINEYKMKLYYLENETLEEKISIANQIDVLLFIYISEYVQDTSLNELAREWFLIKRLILEKDNLSNNVDSVFHGNSPKDHLLKEIEIFIARRIPSLQLLVNRLPSKYSELRAFINNKFQTSFTENKTSIVEEG